MQYHFLVEPSQEKPLTSLTLSMLQGKVGITRGTHTKQVNFQGIDPVNLYINTPCLFICRGNPQLTCNPTVLVYNVVSSTPPRSGG